MRFFVALFIISCSITHARKPAQSLSQEKLISNLSKIYSSAVSASSAEDIEYSIDSVKVFPIFSPYLPWLSHILNIKKTNFNLDLCYRLKIAEFKSLELDFLRWNLKKKCFVSIFENIQKMNPQDHHKIETIFKGHYSYIVSNLNNNFLSFYTKLKTQKKHSLIEKNLIDSMVNNINTPSKENSQHFQKNSRFKSFINKFGYDYRSRVKKDFSKFRKMLKELYNAGGTDKFPKLFKQRFPQILSQLKTNKDTFNTSKLMLQLKNFIPFLSRNKRSQEIRDLNKIVKENYSKHKQIKNDLIFYQIWSYILEGNWAKALQYIQEENLISDFDTLYSRPQYWITEVLYQNNLKDISNKLKVKIVLENPLTYYASIGINDLKSRNNKLYKDSLKFYGQAPSNHYTQNQYITLSKTFNKNFERIRLFNEKTQSTLLANEVNHIKNHSQLPDSILLKLVSIKLQEYGAYLSSFIMIYQGLESKKFKYDKDVLNICFPSPFLKEIKKHQGSIDEILILSLIRQESSFNPYAKSPVGALGIMQLMPGTARAYKKGVTNEELLNPSINIPIGVKYLEFLSEKFSHSLEKILSSYNAGENKVDDWEDTYMNTGSQLHDIENIPYLETRKYVKLISRNMFFYNYIKKSNSL